MAGKCKYCNETLYGSTHRCSETDKEYNVSDILVDVAETVVETTILGGIGDIIGGLFD